MAVFMTGGGGAELVNFVQYIQSSGTQYINLDICPTENTRVVLVGRLFSTPTANKALFGSRNGNKEQFWCLYRPASNAFVSKFGSSSTNYAVAADPTAANTFDMNQNVFTIGKNSVTATDESFTATYPMYLFAVNSAGTAQYPVSMEVELCEVYENDALLCSLRPCFDPDGVACMYDRVSKRYFYNAGTGAFTAG